MKKYHESRKARNLVLIKSCKNNWSDIQAKISYSSSQVYIKRFCDCQIENSAYPKESLKVLLCSPV